MNRSRINFLRRLQGKVPIGATRGSGRTRQQFKDCAVCGGIGQLRGRTCPICDGEGGWWMDTYEKR